jgi:release factor glutamine methyltransferase
VRLIVIPGVFHPISDSRLLADCLRRELYPGARVADICTGSGVLAVTAALHGAGAVSATDCSRRAVWSARLNARLNGVVVRAVRGDLLKPLAGRQFDLIVSNPPYVPAEEEDLPSHGSARAWDAGRNGRVLIDRLCDEAPARLRPGGTLLLVHSSVCDEHATLERLQHRGLETDVMVRSRGVFGPILAARAPALRERGLLAPDELEEEIVVIRAALTAQPGDSAFDARGVVGGADGLGLG